MSILDCCGWVPCWRAFWRCYTALFGRWIDAAGRKLPVRDGDDGLHHRGAFLFPLLVTDQRAAVCDFRRSVFTDGAESAVHRCERSADARSDIRLCDSDYRLSDADRGDHRQESRRQEVDSNLARFRKAGAICSRHSSLTRGKILFAPGSGRGRSKAPLDSERDEIPVGERLTGRIAEKMTEHDARVPEHAVGCGRAEFDIAGAAVG